LGNAGRPRAPAVIAIATIPYLFQFISNMA
jgi:hypothetical protein